MRRSLLQASASLLPAHRNPHRWRASDHSRAGPRDMQEKHQIIFPWNVRTTQKHRLIWFHGRNHSNRRRSLHNYRVPESQESSCYGEQYSRQRKTGSRHDRDLSSSLSLRHIKIVKVFLWCFQRPRKILRRLPELKENRKK